MTMQRKGATSCNCLCSFSFPSSNNIVDTVSWLFMELRTKIYIKCSISVTKIYKAFIPIMYNDNSNGLTYLYHNYDASIYKLCRNQTVLCGEVGLCKDVIYNSTLQPGGGGALT